MAQCHEAATLLPETKSTEVAEAWKRRRRSALLALPALLLAVALVWWRHQSTASSPNLVGHREGLQALETRTTEYDPSANMGVAVCVVDVGQAFFQLGQGLMAINAARISCVTGANVSAADKQACSVSVSYAIAGIVWAVSFATDAISQCAGSLNLQAACATDLTVNLGSWAFLQRCAERAGAEPHTLQSLSMLGGRRLGDADAMDVKKLAPDPIVEREASTLDMIEEIKQHKEDEEIRSALKATCFFDVGHAAFWAARVGTSITQATLDCTEANFASAGEAGKMSCSVDVSGIVGAAAFLGSTIALTVAGCPAALDKDVSNTLCAAAIIDTVGVVGYLAQSFSSIGCSFHEAKDKDMLSNLRGLNVSTNPNVGWLTLTLTDQHVRGATEERLWALARPVMTFRNFFLFHLKHTKSYLHSRLRKRLDHWQQQISKARRRRAQERCTAFESESGALESPHAMAKPSRLFTTLLCVAAMYFGQSLLEAFVAPAKQASLRSRAPAVSMQFLQQEPKEAPTEPPKGQPSSPQGPGEYIVIIVGLIIIAAPFFLFSPPDDSVERFVEKEAVKSADSLAARSSCRLLAARGRCESLRSPRLHTTFRLLKHKYWRKAILKEALGTTGSPSDFVAVEPEAMVGADGATAGWLLKRSAAFRDRWVRHWCVFKYSQEEDILVLDCYADESCRRRLYHICMGKGARVLRIQSEEIPAAFLKFKQQRPHSLIIDAGDGRLCPFFIFDAIDANSHRFWNTNVTSQLQALDLKRRRHQEEQLMKDRTKIIDSIFACLDQRKVGTIWSDGLRRYAETSGFSGSDAEWQHEFQELCEDRGWKEEKEITASQFGKFLSSDTSVSLNELCKILECLQGLYDPPATDSWVKQSVVSKNLQLKSRSDIISALFNCLKSRETGRIGCEELQRYATLSGFDGDDEDWSEEYHELCEEKGWDKDIGLAHDDFMALLEDDSMGSDDELKAMLMELRMPRKRARTFDQMSHSAKQSAAGRVRSAISDMTREELVKEAFASLDVRRNAVLGSREFRRYAEMTGYDGGEESWPELYRELCDDYGWQPGAGVTLEQFTVFIGDESHSSDDELQELVLELRLQQDAALRRFRSAVYRVLWSLRYNGSKPPRGQLTRQDIERMSRKELMDALFDALDRKHTQKLDSKAMRQFAHLTGFYGDDADWDMEFRGMCEHFDWSASEGISRSQFRHFIGDEDNTSSAELQVLIFNLPQNPRSSLMFSRYKGLGREELLDELFTALSEGPEIPSSKLQRVAELTGSSRLRSKSLTKSQFLEILGDDVQTSTEELRRVLLTVRGDVQLSSKPWSRRSFAQAWRSSDVANMDRRSMISAIFTVLDHAKSRTLQSDAIRAYAEQTGFEGTVVEWEEQFAAICHHFGWTQGAGISQSQFNELVEDDDDTDDDELRQALLNLQMQSMRSGRPSLLRSSWQRKSLPHLQGLDVAQTLTRPELISKIFSLLDTAGQTKLFSAQFKKFADLSGFEGDAAEWSSQFAEPVCRNVRALWMERIGRSFRDPVHGVCWGRGREQ
eukprot:s162_g10.t1